MPPPTRRSFSPPPAPARACRTCARMWRGFWRNGAAGRTERRAADRTRRSGVSRDAESPRRRVAPSHGDVLMDAELIQASALAAKRRPTFPMESQTYARARQSLLTDEIELRRNIEAVAR